MASTYSTDLRLELIGNGDQSGTWGTTTNTNLGTLLEESIVGQASVPITDGVNTVITISDGASSTARKVQLTLTGALTANRILEVPAKKKTFLIYNSTTGGFAVTVKCNGQTGVSIPNGAKRFVYVDGTDVRDAITDLPTGSTVGGSGIVTGSSTTTLTNKTLTDPTINVRDNAFSIQDNADATKQLRFEVSGITTGTIRTLTVPNFDGTVATLAGTETFTNKTLTTPTINGATLTGTLSLTGNATFSNPIIVPLGAVGGTSLQFASDPNTGIYSPGADQMNLVTGGTSRLTIDATGAITVTGNLTVNGTASFGGAGAGVTTDGTQTLTNKTIDTAGPNTLKVNGNTLSASAGTGTITFPNTTATLVGRDTTDTLTNKTLTSPTLNGGTLNTPTINVNANVLSIRDNTDTTKILKFDVSGVTTGTTRTLTVPNASGTLVLTSRTLTAGTGIAAIGDLSADRTIGLATSGNFVTNAMLATMTTLTVKANVTGGTAGPTDVALNALLDPIGSTRGSIYFRGASNLQALTPNTAGFVLRDPGSGANPSWVGGITLVASGSVSGVATLDIALPNGYSRFLLHLDDLVPVTNGNGLCMRWSFDSGSSYKSASGDYFCAGNYQNTAGGGGGYDSSTSGTTFIIIGPSVSGLSNTAGLAQSTIIDIWPGAASKRASMTCRGMHQGTGSAFSFYNGGSSIYNGPLTNVRIYYGGGGNIASCTYTLYGVI